MIEKSNQKVAYLIALLLSIAKRKTFESLGDDMGVSGDVISRIVTTDAVTVHELIQFCKTIFKAKRLYLLIDDTLIAKIYSRVIEGACDNFDSSDKRTKRSLCSVVAMVTDGETAIPLDQMLWTSEEYNPENHTKKWELAQSLIKKITPLIGIKMVVLDGFYAVTAFIKWLIKKNIFFEMRLHSNRVVICKGVKAQIRHHKSFKVTGKNPLRTLKVVWNDIELYATAVRRLMKNGDFSIVYQIANYKAPAWHHLQNYGYRWNIEKFFRTAKQHLGLNDCMACKQEKQESHSMGVFLCLYFCPIRTHSIET